MALNLIREDFGEGGAAGANLNAAWQVSKPMAGVVGGEDAVFCIMVILCIQWNKFF